MKLSKSLICLSSLLMLATSCSPSEFFKQFGEFSYKGTYLNEYAVKDITVDEAKELIDIDVNPSMIKKLRFDADVVAKDTVKAVLAKYASLEITVKYYIEESDDQQTRVDLYQGTEFMYLLTSNHYSPFGQMNVKYLFVDDNLLDEMEVENANFNETEENLTSPFSNPYTYHTDENNQLVLQTHSFAELPASVTGGIGATFRQDCELLFDTEGKISLWQSSLGLYTSTPTGTTREGYIFEAAFAWTEK